MRRVDWGRFHGRLGGGLLSRSLSRSTIGAGRFHGRVRDGIGCWVFRSGHQVIDGNTALPFSRGQGEDVSKLFLRFALTGRLGSAASCEIDLVGGAFPSFAFGFYRHAKEGWKPFEQLVPVSFTHRCASTPGLSTWWSTTALGRDLVSRGGSRLDAFSGYPVRT